MVATAGWHCKQPSHLCANRRDYVSATESLPPSSSYMKPQQQPSLSLLPPQREALTPAERWPREMCIILCLNVDQKPSLASIVTNVLRSKQFSYVNLIHSNTMQYVLTLSEHASLRVSLFILL